tara:strand:+ start:12358 stop:13503 length:1146 start_codon:yes stop_codon:yes gene_type:complete
MVIALILSNDQIKGFLKVNFNYSVIVLILLLFYVVSCSPTDYSQAVSAYEEAQKSQKLSSLTLALKKLAQLEPETYQQQLVNAENSQAKLISSQRALATHNYYAAYLASHDSYRSFPSLDSKKVLIESGSQLLILLKAQESIARSYQYRQLRLTSLFERFYQSAVIDWDLIQANNLVSKLNQSTTELHRAFEYIQDSGLQNEMPEVLLWEKAIARQLTELQQVRDYFPDLARHRSAKVLLSLAKSLADESLELLSLVRPSMAKDATQRSFIKAKDEYALYQQVMENISLAENSSRQDIHASWYTGWEKTVLNVLEADESFANYPVKVKQSINNIEQVIRDNNAKSPPSIKDEFYDKAQFTSQFPSINALLAKLKRDKALLI